MSTDLAKARYAHWIELARADLIEGRPDQAERTLRTALRSTCDCSQCRESA